MMMMIEVPKSWQNAHHLVKDVLMPIVQNNLYNTCNMYTLHYTIKVLDLPQARYVLRYLFMYNTCYLYITSIKYRKIKCFLRYAAAGFIFRFFPLLYQQSPASQPPYSLEAA